MLKTLSQILLVRYLQEKKLCSVHPRFAIYFSPSLIVSLEWFDYKKGVIR